MARATSWAVETSEAVEGILAEEETSVGEVNVWNITIECDFVLVFCFVLFFFYFSNFLC